MSRFPVNIMWRLSVKRFPKARFYRAYLNVVNEDLPESGWEHVPGHLGGTVTDVGHLVHTLEAPPHPVVNTLGTPPVLLDLVIPVALRNKHVWSLNGRKFCFMVVAIRHIWHRR